MTSVHPKWTDDAIVKAPQIHPSTSWWITPDRETFQKRAQIEAERMKAKGRPKMLFNRDELTAR